MLSLSYRSPERLRARLDGSPVPVQRALDGSIALGWTSRAGRRTSS